MLAMPFIYTATRVRTVHEKNGSDSVPEFSSTISADSVPDSIYQASVDRLARIF